MPEEEAEVARNRPIVLLEIRPFAIQTKMKYSVHDRLLRRELGNTSQYAGIRGIYGAKEWIEDLDIVNELGGHTGCVNALRYGPSLFAVSPWPCELYSYRISVFSLALFWWLPANTSQAGHVQDAF